MNYVMVGIIGLIGGVTSGLCLYVADCDGLFNRAVEAGGKVRRPLTNQFYGDRSGTVEDPFGQVWTISTHVEDVPPDELRRRAETFRDCNPAEPRPMAKDDAMAARLWTASEEIAAGVS